MLGEYRPEYEGSGDVWYVWSFSSPRRLLSYTYTLCASERRKVRPGAGGVNVLVWRGRSSECAQCILECREP